MNGFDIAMALGGVLGGAAIVVGAIYAGFRRGSSSANSGGGGSAGTSMTQMLLDESKEQTQILRDIKERLIGQAYAQEQVNTTLVRVEQSQQALHRRLDPVVGSRQ